MTSDATRSSTLVAAANARYADPQRNRAINATGGKQPRFVSHDIDVVHYAGRPFERPSIDGAAMHWPRLSPSEHVIEYYSSGDGR